MDSHGLLPLLCIFRIIYTKAAVSLLSKFSKHRSTSSIKLYMKRWHCNFNTIAKESALRSFIFHFCICLRNFFSAFDTICMFQSSVKLFHRQRPIKCIKYLSCKFLVPDLFQQIVSKLWFWVPLPSVHRRDSQDQPDKHPFSSHYS